MTPTLFRAARVRLGLSQAQLARVLRVGSDRTVRKWEGGEREIPGPAVVLMEIFAEFPRVFRIFSGQKN